MIYFVLHQVLPSKYCSMFEDVSTERFESFCETVARKNLTQHVTFTFDDGFTSDLTHAIPIMEKYNINSVHFLITDLINSPGRLSTRQISDILEKGRQIGSHSKSHRDLTALDEKELLTEINESVDAIKKISKHKRVMLSIPYGYYNADVLRATKTESIRKVFCSDINPFIQKGFVVDRISINSTTTQKHFLKMLNPTRVSRLIRMQTIYLKTISKYALPEPTYDFLRKFITR